MGKPTGAVVSIRWHDNGEEVDGYIISFGTYDEDTDTDGFGRNDGDVFWYADGEETLKQLMNTEGTEFTILSYELEG